MTIPISLGILAWKSGSTLSATLKTYERNGLLTLTDDVTILFQEFTEQDKRIADRFGIRYVALPDNIGIGLGFLRLAELARHDAVLLLEHDWHLVEPQPVVEQRLRDGLALLHDGVSCVRFRHRTRYGEPHYSVSRYRGRELDFFDEWIQLEHPHLLDSVHWVESPDRQWPDKIQKRQEHFTSTSRYANWTNNPCLYRKEFYVQVVRPFAGEGDALERNISYWWARQQYMVAHGEGLFEHSDPAKYGSRYLRLLHRVRAELERSMQRFRR